MALSRDLLYLFVAAVVVNLAGNIIGPFFPLYLQSLGAPLITVGLLVSLMNLVQAVLRIPGGIVADRFEKRRIVVASILTAMVPPIIFLFAKDWPQTIPGLLVYGIPFSLFIPTWNVMIADSTDVSSRARVFGMMNMAWPVGFILGPVIGGRIAESLGWNAVMYALLAVYTLGLAPMLIAPPRQRSQQKVSFKIERAALGPFAFYSLYQCLIALSFGVLNTILPIYLTDILGATKSFVGLFWSVCFGVTFLVTQIPGGRLAERVPLRGMLVLGVAAAPLLRVAMPVTQSLLVFTALNVVLNVLWNLSIPSQNVLFLDILPSNGRGFYTGVMEAILMVTWAVAPSLGTFLYENYGNTSPFLASAAFFALATISVRQIEAKRRS